MFELIDTLRQKPLQTKRYIAFGVAFVCIALIFLVWLSVIYPDVILLSERKKAVSQKDPSPFDILSTQLSSVFSGTSVGTSTAP